jgi:hypothetical protein
VENLGRSPDEGEGYAQGTVNGRAYRLDQFYRWVWEQEESYATQITHDEDGDTLPSTWCSVRVTFRESPSDRTI